MCRKPDSRSGLLLDTVKRLYNKDGLIKLLPANPEFSEILLMDIVKMHLLGLIMQMACDQ